MLNYDCESLKFH